MGYLYAILIILIIAVGGKIYLLDAKLEEVQAKNVELKIEILKQEQLLKVKPFEAVNEAKKEVADEKIVNINNSTNIIRDGIYRL